MDCQLCPCRFICNAQENTIECLEILEQLKEGE